MMSDQRRVSGREKRLRFAGLLFTFMGLLLLGCRGDGPRGSADLSVELSIAPTPPVIGEARIVITVSDPEGAPVDGAEVTLEGTMTHAGMEPVHAEAMRQAPGRYVVPDFPFSMAGDWMLTTRVFAAGEASEAGAADAADAAGELLTAHERRVRVVGTEVAPGPDPGGT